VGSESIGCPLQTERTNDIDLLKNKAEKNKERIGALTLEIENKNNLNESLSTENEDMKADITNKASMLARCAEAIRSTRNQMRTLKEENRELRKARYNNPKVNRWKKKTRQGNKE